MEPIRQEDPMGCSVACVAFILQTSYLESRMLFVNNHERVNKIGFICKEIVAALNQVRLKYEYKYITNKAKAKILLPCAIVFLKRSNKYPKGHYLVRTNAKNWMDPWINFPNEPIKAGFRKRLPGKPIYVLYESKVHWVISVIL